MTAEDGGAGNAVGGEPVRRPRIALITCRELPEPDTDQELLLAALVRAGAEPSLLAWDDPAAELDGYDVAVARSCWNYFLDPERFEAWLVDFATRAELWNPLAVLRSNIRKTYLRDLEARGIPIVPTRWIARGERADLAALLEETGWSEVVVKPAISAGSFLTRRFRSDDADEAPAWCASGGDREWMVQPYLRSVEDGGERAIVAIDGEVSHLVRKRPRFAGSPESVSAASVVPTTERLFAARVLAAVGTPLLYARVDAIPDDAGELRLAELELLEPSLFLLQHPPALDRFVAAILERAGRRSGAA